MIAQAGLRRQALRILSASGDYERYKIVNAIDNNPASAGRWRDEVMEKYPEIGQRSAPPKTVITDEDRAVIRTSRLPRSRLVHRYGERTVRHVLSGG